MVVAGDRDSDIYERLKWQSKDREEAGLAARANAAGVLQPGLFGPGRRDLSQSAWTLETQPDFQEAVQPGGIQ